MKGLIGGLVAAAVWTRQRATLAFPIVHRTPIDIARAAQALGAGTVHSSPTESGRSKSLRNMKELRYQQRQSSAAETLGLECRARTGRDPAFRGGMSTGWQRTGSLPLRPLSFAGTSTRHCVT
jgi:hypothetical protein